jgi:putative RecB family exonuclease
MIGTLPPSARSVTSPAPKAPGPPEHISPTAAKSYLGCSLRFFFERVACLPCPTGPALHLGKVIHAALQHFHLALWRGTDHSAPTIAKHFEQVFTAMEQDEGPVSWKDDAARDKAREAGLRVVQAYLTSPEVLTTPPKAVEVFLSERIDGLSVPLTGAMDLVRQDLTPVDFKSAAARPDPKQAAFDHELQLVSYQLMLESATGQSPPALELVFLVKTKVPQVIKVRVQPADSRRKERVVRMLETAVTGIVEQRFHPQPGMQCGWCQFRTECSKWPSVAVEGRGR